MKWDAAVTREQVGIKCDAGGGGRAAVHWADLDNNIPHPQRHVSRPVRILARIRLEKCLLNLDNFIDQIACHNDGKKCERVLGLGEVLRLLPYALSRP
jgi:hypothetical protein